MNAEKEEDLESRSARQSCDISPTGRSLNRLAQDDNANEEGEGEEIGQDSDLSIDFSELVNEQITKNKTRP